MKLFLTLCVFFYLSFSGIAQNKFTDINQQKIYEYQDKRQSKLIIFVLK